MPTRSLREMFQDEPLDKSVFDIHSISPFHTHPEAENDSRLQEHHDFNKHGVTHDERKAIRSYTEESLGVNHHLITGTPMYDDGSGSSLNDLHPHIQSAMKKMPPLKEPLSVFSGTDKKLGSQIKLGSVLHTPAYTSTSVKAGVASSFAKQSKTVKSTGPNYQVPMRRHLMHFKLPEGYNKGMYIGDNAVHGNASEREFLLDHNQKWKVTGHEAHPGKNYLMGVHNIQKKIYTHVWTLEPHNEGN